MKEEIKYWYLKNHKLFEHLSEQDVEALCLMSSFKQGNKNDIIYFSDSDKKRLYTIKEGILKICYQDIEGKEVITEMLTENDIFGYISLNSSDNTLKDQYAVVLSDKLSICSFDVENFKIVLEKNKDLHIKYSNLINEKLVSFQQKYSDLVFKDVNTRVAEFFKRYAHYHSKTVNGVLEMEMVLTHQEIADYTASSRQSVTSIINKLVEEGKVIYEGRKKVIIPDINRL
jgi:CRP/FNR family transcriptional regulator, cyclic AMP receptor protein